MDAETDAIDEFLKENGIDHLKAVIGFSLGGNMAFYYFCHHSTMIDQVIVDTAPIIKFPHFIKSYFYNKFRRWLNNARNHPDKAAEVLNQCFHGMGDAQQYIAPIVSFDSLKNLIESCFHVEDPKLDSQTQRKITFVYGKEDTTRLCLPRIRKYKNSEVIIAASMGHCGYFQFHSDDDLTRLLQ